MSDVAVVIAYTAGIVFAIIACICFAGLLLSNAERNYGKHCNDIGRKKRD